MRMIATSEVPKVLAGAVDDRAHRFLAGDVLAREAVDPGVAAVFIATRSCFHQFDAWVSSSKVAGSMLTPGTHRKLANAFRRRLCRPAEEDGVVHRVRVVHRDEDLHGRVERRVHRARTRTVSEDDVRHADVALVSGSSLGFRIAA